MQIILTGWLPKFHGLLNCPYQLPQLLLGEVKTDQLRYNLHRLDKLGEELSNKLKDLRRNVKFTDSSKKEKELCAELSSLEHRASDKASHIRSVLTSRGELDN